MPKMWWGTFHQAEAEEERKKRLMGMSTHVVLLRDGSSEKHQKKIRAMEALIDAKVVKIPTELLDYFGVCDQGEFDPGTSGLEVKDKDGCVTAWSDSSRSGYEIDLTKKPQGVVRIRFYNSW